MAAIAKKRKRYPSNLTDEEYGRIAQPLPAPGRTGRPREVEFREVINAIRYLVRSGCGCGWRMLPYISDTGAPFMTGSRAGPPFPVLGVWSQGKVTWV